MGGTIIIKRKAQILSIVIAVVALGGVGAYLTLRQAQDMNNVFAVTAAVARHYQLPEDEVPALATVEDKGKLNSEFLRSAENGDKLLVYKNAKKVILYRPSIDKIIEVGPVSIADMSQ
jgi:hypothetical protein